MDVYVPRNLQIYPISNCAAQIKNCETANQVENCAAKFMPFQNCAAQIKNSEIAQRNFESRCV